MDMYPKYAVYIIVVRSEYCILVVKVVLYKVKRSQNRNHRSLEIQRGIFLGVTFTFHLSGLTDGEKAPAFDRRPINLIYKQVLMP